MVFHANAADIRIEIDNPAVVGGGVLRGRVLVTVRRQIDFTAIRLHVTGREVIETNLSKGDEQDKAPAPPRPTSVGPLGASDGTTAAAAPDQRKLGLLRSIFGTSVTAEETFHLDELITLFGFTAASGRSGGSTLSPGVRHYPFEVYLPAGLCPTYHCRMAAADLYPDPVRREQNRGAYVECYMAYALSASVVKPGGVISTTMRSFTVHSSLSLAHALAPRRCELHFRQDVVEEEGSSSGCCACLAALWRCCCGCFSASAQRGEEPEIFCDAVLSPCDYAVDPAMTNRAVAVDVPGAGTPQEAVSGALSPPPLPSPRPAAEAADEPVVVDTAEKPQPDHSGGGIGEVEKPFSLNTQEDILVGCGRPPPPPPAGVAQGIPVWRGEGVAGGAGEYGEMDDDEQRYPAATAAALDLPPPLYNTSSPPPAAAARATPMPGPDAAAAGAVVEAAPAAATTDDAVPERKLKVRLSVQNRSQLTPLSSVRAVLLQVQTITLPAKLNRAKVRRAVVIASASVDLRLEPSSQRTVDLPLAMAKEALRMYKDADAERVVVLPTFATTYAGTSHQLRLEIDVGRKRTAALLPMESVVPLELRAGIDITNTAPRLIYNQNFRFPETELGKYRAHPPNV